MGGRQHLNGCEHTQRPAGSEPFTAEQGPGSREALCPEQLPEVGERQAPGMGGGEVLFEDLGATGGLCRPWGQAEQTSDSAGLQLIEHNWKP